jgi:hypothetical protein
MKIEGTGIEQLARLTAQLTKEGVGFNAQLHEDKNYSWTVTMTGAF